MTVRRPETLDDVLERWRRFGDALRLEDRTTFFEMLERAEPIAKVLFASGEILPSEALVMATLLVLKSSNTESS